MNTSNGVLTIVALLVPILLLMNLSMMKRLDDHEKALSIQNRTILLLNQEAGEHDALLNLLKIRVQLLKMKKAL